MGPKPAESFSGLVPNRCRRCSGCICWRFRFRRQPAEGQYRPEIGCSIEQKRQPWSKRKCGSPDRGANELVRDDFHAGNARVGRVQLVIVDQFPNKSNHRRIHKNFPDCYYKGHDKQMSDGDEL